MNLADNQKTMDSVIIEMLTENTGSHFLDSGGAYGRKFEQNQKVKNWKDTPEGSLSMLPEKYNLGNGWYFDTCSISLFHHLRESLWKPAQKAQSILDMLSKNMPDDSWDEVIEAFLIGKICEERGLCGYTYNDTDNNLLDQDFVYQCYECIDGNEYVIIRTHNGCDARGGFSSPKVFLHSDYDRRIWDHGNGTIYCQKCFGSWHIYGLDQQAGNPPRYDGMVQFPQFPNIEPDEICLKETVMVEGKPTKPGEIGCDSDGNVYCPYCFDGILKIGL